MKKKTTGTGIFFLCVFLLYTVKGFSFPANKIEDVLFSKKDSTEIVTIHFKNSSSKIKPFTLHNKERIVIDIKNAFVPNIRFNKETGGKIINQIRISQNRKDTVRIVLDIQKDTLYKFELERTSKPNNPPVVKIITCKLPTKDTRISVPELRDSCEDNQTLSTEKKSVPPPAPEEATEKERQSGTEPPSTLALYDEDLPKDIFTESTSQEKKSFFSFSGLFQTRTTIDTQNEARIENETSLKNRLLLKSKYKNILTLSVLSDYLYFGHENETDNYDLDLYEANYKYNNDNIALTIGKQIIRWGKADRISPVDTINPTDMREFIIPEYEENKIPVWMADLNLFLNNSRLEAVFIPFFEEAELDYFKSDWAVFPHIKEELRDSSLPPALKSYFRGIRVHEKDPAREEEFALRFTSTIKNIDFDISWHHTREDIPYFKSFPVKNIRVDGDISKENLLSSLNNAVLTNEDIEVEYRRTETAGFAFETIAADFGIRGEAAWHENQSYLTSSLTSIRRQVFEYILGADYTTGGDTYLNLELAHRHIYGYDSDILYFDEDTYSLLGEISRDFFSDWLEACLYYSVSLNDRSLYLSPRLECTYITNLDLIIGANIFSGDDNTWLGRFDENDQLFLDISYHF